MDPSLLHFFKAKLGVAYDASAVEMLDALVDKTGIGSCVGPRLVFDCQ